MTRKIIDGNAFSLSEVRVGDFLNIEGKLSLPVIIYVDSSRMDYSEILGSKTIRTSVVNFEDSYYTTKKFAFEEGSLGYNFLHEEILNALHGKSRKK